MPLGRRAPLIYVSYPNAGASRMTPVFNRLMQVYRRPQFFMEHAHAQKRIVDKMAAYVSAEDRFILGERNIPKSVTDDYYVSGLSAMNYYFWMDLHGDIGTEALKTLRDHIAVYLIRDPRDVMASQFKFLPPKYDEENFRKYILGGYDFVNCRHTYAYRHPSLLELCENFAGLLDCPNVCIVRYEDIRRDPVPAYRKMLRWLNFENPLLPLSDGELFELTKLGTFEFQSGGKMKEGDFDRPLNMNTTMRKGIVGDWKNVFPDSVWNEVRPMVEPYLRRLGYA